MILYRYVIYKMSMSFPVVLLVSSGVALAIWLG